MAKNLLIANQRIMELESIITIRDDEKRRIAIFKYNNTWNNGC